MNYSEQRTERMAARVGGISTSSHVTNAPIIYIM